MRWLLLALLVACNRDPKAAPPCGAVGAKLLVLARADLDAKSPNEDTRRLVLDQLPAMRDALVGACVETKWGDAVRRCMVDATDHVGFETCQQQLTDAQRQALEPKKTAPPPS